MRNIKLVGLLLGLAGVMTTPLMAAKPIAVVGGAAQLDVSRFLHRVLARNDYAWELKGDFLDPRDFARYSMVVWFGGCRDKLSPEQVVALHAYLDAGGILMHTASGLYRSLPEPLHAYPWLGVTAWQYHRQPESRVKGRFLEPTHPFLAGTDTAKDYHWLDAHYSLKTTGATTSLIGSPTDSIFAATPVGHGMIVWFWEGLFRCRNWQKPEDGAALERIFLNVLRSARPQTAGQLVQEQVPELRTDPASLVCWRRDWVTGAQNDYVFLPPHPAAQEHVTAITFNSAMDERDTQFLLCQSLKPQPVTAAIAPLVHEETRLPYARALRLFISDKPPVVPNLAKMGQDDFPNCLGRFMLLPVTNGFAIHDFRPRVLWLELATHGLPPGHYCSELKLKGDASTATLPVTVTVHPVRMPANRLVQLRYWGGAMPSREPHLAEMERQGANQIALCYPDMGRIILRHSGQSLLDAMRRNPAIFTSTNFPALDFRAAYDNELMLALRHKLSYIRVSDVRTGMLVAQAGTGLNLSESPRADLWPDAARQLYTHYYRELHAYLQERGFEEADEIWTDEPSWDSITNSYAPRAALHIAGGMGSGSIWSASGFMSPAEANRFAPYTTDWSMYTIGLPNFLNFVRSGAVPLHPRARIGIARGGCGYALRNAFNLSRTLGWAIIRYGEPVSFLRTGPLWKEGLYYVDFDTTEASRPQGIEGERLIAYGSGDRMDGLTPMLSSSDWEASREGVDDANLARILEWYLARLAPRAASDKMLAAIIREIDSDRATWFRVAKTTGPQAAEAFDGDRLVEADQARIPGAPGHEAGFTVVRKHYAHGANVYDYEDLQPLPSDGIEAMKRRVLQHLNRLAPYADRMPASLRWHDWELVSDGTVTSRIVVSPQAGPAVAAAVAEFQERCRMLAGLAPGLMADGDWQPDGRQVTLIVGQATDPLVQAVLKRHGWSADAAYPGAGGYLIQRDRNEKLLLIVGVDDTGTQLGLGNFSVFLQASGHWIVPQPAPGKSRLRKLMERIQR